ncbi:TPA: hypothetical protein ACGO43_001079 [Streptococcus suis]|nr:hypothetical protein [Streptococcus suis]HEM2780562.1 hypothetical protein [Streptococcus suis]HEM3580773.1 hypothetical protein [Streptococcus suis]
MAYVIDHGKLNAKNIIIDSLRQEMNEINHQSNALEQSLLSLVTSYFESGISSTGDQVSLELRQVRDRLLQMTGDLEAAIHLAEKLDVLTWVEDDDDGQTNSRYY